MLSNSSSVSRRKRVAQVVVEVGKQPEVGLRHRQVAQVEPLAGEVGHQRIRARVRQHAPGLLREHRRVPQAALPGQREELVVRDAAPQEEGEPRGQRPVVQLVRRGRPDVPRVGLQPEQERRTDQHARQRALDAAVEAAAAAPVLVEVHQDAQLGVGGRPPEGPPRQRRHDPPRAGRLVAAAGRAADEDAVAARGAVRQRRIERASDDDLADVRDLVRLAVLEQGAQERPPHALDLRRGPLEEGGAHAVRSGLHGQAHVQVVVLQLVPLAAVVRVPARHAGARGQQLDTRPVERDLQRVRLPQADDAVAVAREADADLVLAVDRKEMLHARAAARAERHPVEPVRLRELRRHLVDVGGHGDGRAAGDGEPADPVGGREVALELQRRHAQHVADVVEAVAGSVGGQQRGHVDVQRQQVAHGVAVLGAVEAVQHRRPAGVRPRSRRGVEPGLDPGRRALVDVGARPRTARRRHRPVPQSADDLLPLLGGAGRIRGVERVEHQPRIAADGGPLVVASLAVALQDGPGLGASRGNARVCR